MGKRFAAWAAVCVVFAFAATAWVYGQLPDRVPAHWNAAGRIDRYGPRGWIFALPVVLLVFALAWRLPPAMAPERFRGGAGASAYWFCGMVLCTLLAATQGVILSATRGGGVDLAHTLLAALALALAVILARVVRRRA